jgi:hypothetical protein
MISDLQSEIYENLSRYLRDEMPLQDFEDWFAPILWDLADSQDGASRSLGGSISNRIAEYSSGDRSEESLREELEKAIRASQGPTENLWQHLRQANIGSNEYVPVAYPVSGNNNNIGFNEVRAIAA